MQQSGASVTYCKDNNYAQRHRLQNLDLRADVKWVDPISKKRTVAVRLSKKLPKRDPHAVAFASVGFTSSLSSNSNGAGCPESCTKISAATNRDGTSVMIMPALIVSDAIPGFSVSYRDVNSAWGIR